MPLPGPGVALSLDDIGTEFTAAGASQPHQLSEFYRGGGIVGNFTANASVPTSGTIAIGNFYNASGRNAYTVSITSNVNNYNAYSSRSPNYVAGFSDITYDISPGVVIGSTSTTAAFLVPNQFNAADTVFIRNRGTILGRGGNAGVGGNAISSSSFNNGQPAGNGSVGISVSRPVTINNQNGTIAGGGGGGGGGGAAATPSFFQPPSGYSPSVFYPQALAGGGGGGGGRGGGTGGQAGTPLGQPGSSGTSTTAGGGGNGGSQPSPWGGGTAIAGGGGAGGGLGANGTNGQSPPSSPAGARSGGTRGTAGSATQNAPQYVTWQATGTRLGPIA